MTTLSELIRTAALEANPRSHTFFSDWLGGDWRDEPPGRAILHAMYVWFNDDHCHWYEKCPIEVRRMALLFLAEAVE